jgi:hypothetical protein
MATDLFIAGFSGDERALANSKASNTVIGLANEIW